jgi:hypothetical protein
VLAKALVKIKRECNDNPVADWMYRGWACRKRLFSERLRGLGWTGEEDFSEEKTEKFYDHWEVA